MSQIMVLAVYGWVSEAWGVGLELVNTIVKALRTHQKKEHFATFNT